MTPTELLAELVQRGITLSKDGENLRARGPKAALALDLLEALAQHKARLLAFLEARPSRGAPRLNRKDQRCEVHRRYLTFAEALHGECSWCVADPAALADWPDRRGSQPG